MRVKKLRLLSVGLSYDRCGTAIGNFKNRGFYVREYSNPEAKTLYKQAKKTRDLKEKVRLYSAMGEYELKSLNLAEIARNWFNKFIMDNLF